MTFVFVAAVEDAGADVTGVALVAAAGTAIVVF
jgi:hypothetical protein